MVSKSRVSTKEILDLIFSKNFGENGSLEYDALSATWDTIPDDEHDIIERELIIYLADRLGIDGVEC